MAVGLACRTAREQPHPRRKGRGHVGHRLAGRDQLLRQQPAKTVRALDRPAPVRPTFGENLEFADLVLARGHPQLSEYLSGRVEHDRGVRALVGIDPDDDVHAGLLVRDLQGPLRTVLMRAGTSLC